MGVMAAKRGMTKRRNSQYDFQWKTENFPHTTQEQRRLRKEQFLFGFSTKFVSFLQNLGKGREIYLESYDLQLSK